MAETAPNSQLSRPPLLCLGCARTGTASLAEALRILGFNNIHHGLRVSSVSPEWDILERAADATFPILPSYTNKPFSRSEWDAWCQDWDVVTDVSSFYATSLIPAYPDAKVILVEREFEAWFKSWTAIQSHWASNEARDRVLKIEKRCSINPGTTCEKFTTGWMGTTDMSKIVDKETMRKTYERHYAYIRATVPKELLLDFKLSDGWGPLCAFLEKSLPDQPFPHVNESAEYHRVWKTKRNETMKMLAKSFIPGGKKRVAAANSKRKEALGKEMASRRMSGHAEKVS